MARQSIARATELLFIAEHSFSPDEVLTRFRIQPDGGSFHDGNTYYEWGNIRTLINGKLHGRAKVMSVSDKPRYIYHLDRLAKSRHEAIEAEHAIPHGAISGSLTNCKADVLVVDGAGRPFLVSFKEIEGQAKLGQVSADTAYGSAELDGGIDDLDISALPIPVRVTAADTALTAQSFEKLSLKDQKLAYYKTQHASSWRKYVEERSQAAKLNLRQFASKISLDRQSFLDFVGATLAGSSRGSSDFYIVLGDQLIQFQNVLLELASPRWSVQTSDASTPKKHALLVTVSDGKSTYILTRIEQSFEGAKETVSQTKGIIFHFQQHPRSGMNYKRLLLDLR